MVKITKNTDKFSSTKEKLQRKHEWCKLRRGKLDTYLQHFYIPEWKMRSEWLKHCAAGCTLWSRDPGHAHLGVILWSIRSTQGGSVMYVCTKFEADRSFRSKVIRGVPKFRYWVTWPRPRPLRGRLWFLRWEAPSCMSVPNLKRIALFVQKLLGSPKFRPATEPFLGAQVRQNLISWRWSLPAPTDPVWWRLMHAISSYRGNRHRSPATNTVHPPQTHTQTGPITIHCATS